MKPKLRPGDTVRVPGEQGTSKIRAILTSRHAVYLEKKIGRFRNWNIDEVRLVKRGKNTEMPAETRAKLTANWREVKRDLVKRR